MTSQGVLAKFWRTWNHRDQSSSWEAVVGLALCGCILIQVLTRGVPRPAGMAEACALPCRTPGGWGGRCEPVWPAQGLMDSPLYVHSGCSPRAFPGRP